MCSCLTQSRKGAKIYNLIIFLKSINNPKNSLFYQRGSEINQKTELGMNIIGRINNQLGNPYSLLT